MQQVRGQRKASSKMVWRHRSLGGNCVVLRTKKITVKAVGEFRAATPAEIEHNPPQLYFYLPRKPRRPLLVTFLTHEPAGRWQGAKEWFVPFAGITGLPLTGYETVHETVRDWFLDRDTTKEAARNQGLPPSLIDDIYPETGRPDITALRRKYPKWPVVGTIQIHIARQDSHGQTKLILLSGSKRRPVVVATAGKPTDPNLYTLPPTLVWTAAQTRYRNLLNLHVGQRGLTRDRQEAKKLFRLLDLDTNILDPILT